MFINDNGEKNTCISLTNLLTKRQ